MSDYSAIDKRDDGARAYVFWLGSKDRVWCDFATLTIFVEHGESGRDRRRASPMVAAKVNKALTSFGHRVRWISSVSDLDGWLLQSGWAMASTEFSERYLKAFLETRECVTSPQLRYLDAQYRAAGKRRPPNKMKRDMFTRDGNKCRQCGSHDSLTADHAIPYSKGGETSLSNLATLCKSCNQGFGNAPHPDLLMGLDYDPNQFRPSRDGALDHARYFSSNLMYSRARLDAIPSHAASD